MANGKPKGKKEYIKITKSGAKAEVGKKAVDDSRARKGAFEDPKDYKGRVVKGKSGEMAGIVTHAGEYMRATGPVQRRALEKKLAKDKAIQAERAKSKEQRNQRFRDAERKPNSTTKKSK